MQIFVLVNAFTQSASKENLLSWEFIDSRRDINYSNKILYTYYYKNYKNYIIFL